MKKNNLLIIQALLASLILFVLHSVLFKTYFSAKRMESFFYTLQQLYGSFTGATVIIILLLIFVRKKNLDYVGYSFLAATALKMGVVSYFFLKLKQHHGTNVSFEKINFFIVFIFFLLIETVITAQILNKKQ